MIPLPVLPAIPWGRLGIGVGVLAGVLLYALWQGAERRADKWQSRSERLQRALGEAEMEKGRREAEARRIAQETKERHDEEVATIRADAARLRLQGPGAARCAPVLSSPARPGGQGPAKPDAPGPALPPDDRAAVPWPWIVQRAEAHDALRSEVVAWRDWHKRLSESWGK